MDPVVWLPAILASTALIGHVLVWRGLSGAPAVAGGPLSHLLT
jgi:hypothetical protein